MFELMQELLTFVAMRLFLPKGSSRLPRAVANALYQIIAMVAQQFEGYIFTVNVDEVWPQGLVAPILGQIRAHSVSHSQRQCFPQSIFLDSDTVCPNIHGWKVLMEQCMHQDSRSCVHALTRSLCCCAWTRLTAICQY